MNISPLTNNISTIQPLLSTKYSGEWINVTLGKDRVDRRFVKPKIVFENPSGSAICLGNGTSRLEYPTWKFSRVNERKILKYYNVMYGCNAVYRDWQPDFLITTDQLLAAKMPNESHSTAYAPKEIMRRYEKMNLLPGSLRLDAGSAAVYLACFHGAHRVFLYGYDGQSDENCNNNVYADSEFYDTVDSLVSDAAWIKNLNSVISAYQNVEFIRVAANTEDNYRILHRNPNYRVVNFRSFISLADL